MNTTLLIKKSGWLIPLFIGTLMIMPGTGFSLPVIPGENPDLFGMTTPAGSGRHLATPFTNICKVTNLSDDGPGSLRSCLQVAESRTVIFDVSGTIWLKSPLTVPSYTTIAGQTAPSPGITLRGWHMATGGDDILIQHLRIRIGDHPKGNTYFERDALVAGKNSQRFIFDHNSLSWSIDELVNGESSDTTYVHNIFSEALHSPLHPKGPHSRGLLITGQYDGDGGNEALAARNVAVVGNLFAHNMARNPVLSADATGVVVNNVMYNGNVAPKCDDHGYVQLCSVYENVIKRMGNFVARAAHTDTRIYYGPHLFSGATYTYPEIWDLVSTPFEPGVPESNRASSPPITVPSLVVRSADTVEGWVLANAGARPTDRDPVDARMVNDVINGTGNIIASQTEVGGWPELMENYRPLTVPGNAHEIQPSGYTALEEWLHAFAQYVEGESAVLPPGTPGAVPSPNPTVSVLLWAEPASIAAGQSTELQWISTGATTCTSTNFETLGETNSSVTISPSETTTYSIECASDTGSDTDTITVGVVSYQAPDIVARYNFNEGAGLLLTDFSGNDHHGTIDGASWTEGHTGTALLFDGTNDVVPTSLDMGQLSAFTITAWMHPSAFNGREGMFSSAGLLMHYNLGQWEFTAIDNTGKEICKKRMGSLLLTTASWNFIAFTYDGNDCAIHYKDAYEIFPAIDWRTLRPGNLSLGRGNGAYADSWFDGLLDDVYIYNYALSQTELENLKAGRPLRPLFPWPMFMPAIENGQP